MKKINKGRKIVVVKKTDLPVVIEQSECGCDFCGEGEQLVFTSTYSDDTPYSDCQICFNCVAQLASRIPPSKTISKIKK